MNLARSRTAEARLVERAKIILACLDGKRNDEVARELGVRPNTVGVWRQRFASRGMAGLPDHPRPGKKPKYGERCGCAFGGNWSCRRRQGWPDWMAVVWPWR